MTDINQLLNQPRVQLLPKERDLFIRFLAQHGHEYQKWEFAHHFGPPAIPTEGLPENLRYWAEVVSRLRADAIGWRGGQPVIFEIKPYAKPSVIGQLQGYKFFWHDEYPSEPSPILAIICEAFHPALLPLAREAEIEIYQV